VPLFHAWEDTRTPVHVSFWTLLVNAGGGLILMQYYSYLGLAAALSLASVFNALVLFVLMRRNLGRNLNLAPLGGVLFKVCAASMVMGMAVYSVLQYGEWEQGFNLPNTLCLGSAVAGGIAVYTLTAVCLRLNEITEIGAMLKRKIRH
jgi:putative peptidoglycan lipid II flippase